MGRGIVESGLFRTERVGLEVRTSDPAITKEGDYWVRSDIAPASEQIATLRFDRGASIVDIPIFNSAASVTNVKKVWRLEVGGVTGFVPLAASGESGSYPWLRFQHGGAALETHNALEVSAIPDSVVDNFEDNDLDEYTSTSEFAITSTSPVEGSYMLSITGNPGNTYEMYSDEGSGLEYYPQKGDKFSVLMYDSDLRLPAFNFGLDSSGPSAYYFNHYPNNNIAELGKNTGAGSITVLNEYSITLSKATWYEYEIQWHDGSGSLADNTIEITVYETDTSADLSSELGRLSEVGSFTATDSDNATQRGVGFSDFVNSPSGDGYMDRVWHLGSVD